MDSLEESSIDELQKEKQGENFNNEIPTTEGDWLDKHDKFINDFSREGREIKKDI